MSPDFIDMHGQMVGTLQVTEYAQARARRAYWWVVCTACKHQQQERGCNLRKAQTRADWRIVCKGCGG